MHEYEHGDPKFVADSGCQAGHFCPLDIGEINYTQEGRMINVKPKR